MRRGDARILLALGAAVALGALHGLSFGSSRAIFVQPALLTLACVVALALPGRSSWTALAGFAAGFCASWLAFGFDWLATGLAASTALGPALGIMFHVALAAAVGALPALGLVVGAALAVRARGTVAATAALTGAFACAELARFAAFGSASLMHVGYIQIDSWLSGFMPVVGVPGTGVIVVAIAAAFAVWLERALRSRNLQPAALASAVVLAGAAIFAGHALRDVEWTTASGPSLRVQLLQTAAAPGASPRIADVAAVLDALDLDAQRTDLAVLPESAVAMDWDRVAAPLREALASRLRAGGGHALIGTYGYDAAVGPLNVAVLVAPGALPGDFAESAYVKRHLMPFGEYTPPALGWFVELLQVPMTDLGAAPPDSPSLLEVRGVAFRPSLCLELLYGGELATDAREAGFVVNQSNTAWFPAARARTQFVGVARARALEQRKPVVLVGNGGPTAVIGPHGTIVALADFGRAATLRAIVQPRSGATPYADLGDALAWLAALLLAAIGAGAAVRSAGARASSALAARGGPATKG